jgi:hypothetical protein
MGAKDITVGKICAGKTESLHLVRGSSAIPVRGKKKFFPWAPTRNMDFVRGLSVVRPRTKQ